MKKLLALLMLSSTLIIGCDAGASDQASDTSRNSNSPATTLEKLIESDASRKEDSSNYSSLTDTQANATSDSETLASEGFSSSIPSPDELPIDSDYIMINENIPFFSNQDLEISEPFFTNAELDDLGRVGIADALLDQELMPSEERGSIRSIYPTGWEQEKYDTVSGGWLYNRSHLIGHQLTGYDEKENLITGTRQFNVDGMLPFENFVANAVEEQDLRVRYRVTPIFKDDNLLAHGVLMEGYSIDDDGATLTFNIFVPNQQDGVTLDYQTGKSTLD